MSLWVFVYFKSTFRACLDLLLLVQLYITHYMADNGCVWVYEWVFVCYAVLLNLPLQQPTHAELPQHAKFIVFSSCDCDITQFMVSLKLTSNPQMSP